MADPIKIKLVKIVGPTGGTALVPSGEVHKYLANTGYKLYEDPTETGEDAPVGNAKEDADDNGGEDK